LTLTPSVARNHTIPQTSYKCSKHRKATIAYSFATLCSGPDEPAKLVEEGIVVREVLPIGPGLYADFRERRLLGTWVHKGKKRAEHR
jgi:hypothetical protein